jgi:putative oxidoreductase
MGGATHSPSGRRLSHWPRWRLFTFMVAVGACVLWLATAAFGAMVVRLRITPSEPKVGERAVIEVRTFAPFEKSGGSFRLEPHDFGAYPFRIIALGPSHRVVRIVVRRSAKPAIVMGSTRFPVSGAWTIRVLNFPRPYDASSGGTARINVVRGTRRAEGRARSPNASNFLLVLRFGLGGVLLLAALEKIHRRRAFAVALSGYRILPSRFVRSAGTCVILAELAASLGLVSGIGLSYSLFGAAILFGIFVVAISITLVRHVDVPCACFGADPLERVSAGSLVRTGSLFVGALVAVGINLRESHASAVDTSFLPALILGSTLVLVARLSGLAPIAIRAFRTKPVLVPVATGRRTFRHEPLGPVFASLARLPSEHGSPTSVRGEVA